MGEEPNVHDSEPGSLEQRAPLRLGAVAYVRGIAQPLGLLDVLAHEEVVDHENSLAAHPRHLVHCSLDVAEVVSSYSGRNDVEALVRERERLRRADDVRLHPRRCVAAHDLEPCFPEPPRDVPAAGRDVERRARPGRPLDDQVEILALAMRIAVAIGARSLVPHVLHPASSTTRRAASSIVSSTWTFGGSRIREQAPPLLRLGAVEPHDDRYRDLHALERL